MKQNTYKLKDLYYVRIYKNIKNEIIIRIMVGIYSKFIHYFKSLYLVVIIFLVFIFLIHKQRGSKTKVNNNVFIEAEEVC